MTQTQANPETTDPITTSTVILDLVNAGLDYEGTPAVNGITMQVCEGDRLALLGANGSGKSTLLKMLDGLLIATSGDVRFRGQNLTSSGLDRAELAFPLRREIAMLFQNADTQLFCASVRDEIAFGPSQLGLEGLDVKQRVVDCAHLTGVEHLLDRPPFRLSAGEKRRVALAASLAINPSVLLLDEPTGGLDPRSRVWLMEFLHTWTHAGKTVVLATHDLELAAVVTDRAVVLGEDHRIAAAGPTDEILRDTELLKHVNLIHDQFHWHGGFGHAHPHPPESDHRHGD